MKGTHRESVLQDIGLHKLSDRRKIHQVTLFYKIKNGLVPGYISDLCPIRVGQRSEYTLRSSNDLCVPVASTGKFTKSFLPLTIKVWNILPEQQRNSSSIDSFRNNLIRDLFYVPPANKLFNLGDRYLSILHTRLRNILDKRFGNQQQIVNAHMNALLNLPKVTNVDIT